MAEAERTQNGNQTDGRKRTAAKRRIIPASRIFTKTFSRLPGVPQQAAG
ncbi:FtsH protease regulator HflC [Neisseria shayeganii 871]|uniref:FtsH protease regulator HflC n=1 Tax=Neisseria shayeganii 871 TaxID=1032488 RepID=G4CL77_9NEIS|nr:FtsH protease regulator HflC [Neisseria shayeganii 871]